MIPDNLKEKRAEIRKQRKKESNIEYYKKLKDNMKVCECCACAVVPSYWNKHLETKRHKRLSEFQEKISPRNI